MKSNIVTSGSNKYTNLRFNSSLEAKAVRFALRMTNLGKRVDPYYEAKRTVRVYSEV